MKDNPPCTGRMTLFEPFRLPGEADADRSERLEAARAVCSRCPLLDKAECMLNAKSNDLTRGVWGGKVITQTTQNKEKIDVRIRQGLR